MVFMLSKRKPLFRQMRNPPKTLLKVLPIQKKQNQTKLAKINRTGRNVGQFW